MNPLVKLARIIMMARQGGVDKEFMLRFRVEESKSLDRIYRKLVSAAYEIPIYSEAQQKIFMCEAFAELINIQLGGSCEEGRVQ